MLAIWLGPDDFSKKDSLKILARQAGAFLEIFNDSRQPPMPENLIQQDLFSGPKIFALEGLPDFFRLPGTVEKLVASKNKIFFIAEKIDRRESAGRELFQNKNIEVKNFNLPHGRQLDEWIMERVKFYKGRMNKDAAGRLAALLGRDEAREIKAGGKLVSVEEIFNLWQADGEIQKLAAYANGQDITVADVEMLVPENGETDAFDLVNAIAENRGREALGLLHRFLRDGPAADEKASVIQLNALLSEQFRNIAMVQSFLEEGRPETEILSFSGWKSGRLYVMKKFAGKFRQKKVLDFLGKLKALDEELKSGSVPPRVLLDLIIVQLLQP